MRHWSAIALSLSCATAQIAIAQSGARERLFHKRFYVAFTSGSFHAVPVSLAYRDTGSFADLPEVKSSGSGHGLGIGYSVVWGGWLFQFGFDHASATFTDWRVSRRRIAFNTFVIPRVPLAAYVVVGGGWYKQSAFASSSEPCPQRIDPGAFCPSDFEAMPEIDYPIHAGLGAELGWRYVTLRAEVRQYWGTGGGSGLVLVTNGVPSPAGELPALRAIATRVLVGLQPHFRL